MAPLETRIEAYAPYLQTQFEKEERMNSELDEYIRTGKRTIRMPSIYSNKGNCTGRYPVSGYTREDGTKVNGYMRNCYIHGY